MQPDQSILWEPQPAAGRDSGMARFAEFVRESCGAPVASYASLHRWSVEEPEAFWPAVTQFSGLAFATPPASVLEAGDAMPGARWFNGAQLNFAQQLLRFRDDRPALVFVDESGQRRVLSYRSLHAEVAAVARGLRAAGVSVGDRVAGYVPNVPESVIAMLATTSVGAIWSSCSPDFGLGGANDRFGQIAPRILFVADGYRYGGKTFDSRPVAAELVDRVQSIERVVVLPVLHTDPDISAISAAVAWQEFRIDGDSDIDFVQTPFDHPVYILYSSGTTGPPKCIVHGAGGTLLQHLKEHQLHCDLRRDDVLFFYTTCGWMMWNWLVSGLASGATLVLYEGSPFHPDPQALWRIADREGLTHFGAGAKYFSALEQTDCRPVAEVDLGALRLVLSTGSPLSDAGFDFVYRAIKADVQLSSISGGTDIIGCFALGNPMLPVRRGELQCVALGMDVAIFDDEGLALGPGEKGELVCRRPFPSMPVGFWGDADGHRYREAYFARFPGVWAHGDFAELTPSGGMIIHGRSDAVLNPGGVRIGTAEIYRQLDTIEQIVDAVAVGQAWNGDTRVVLFIVLGEGAVLDAALEERIRSVIRRHATPRHVPARILTVPEVPRTRSGKVVELAVRDIVNGQTVRAGDSLANPESLQHFRDRPELRS